MRKNRVALGGKGRNGGKQQGKMEDFGGWDWDLPPTNREQRRAAARKLRKKGSK